MKALGHTVVETSQGGFHSQSEPMLVPYLKNQKYKVSSQIQNDPPLLSPWRRPCEDEGTFLSLCKFFILFLSLSVLGILCIYK